MNHLNWCKKSVSFNAGKSPAEAGLILSGSGLLGWTRTSYLKFTGLTLYPMSYEE